ncbi:MAG: hypothetical protein B9S32_11035 [Verrucomicrobia bacterium Tous-C9LFEB]|nr:MAG: hypothetical protein B9S32_11035 [Verrucomicrobia bacterium Tous-C9LFEB]
MGTTAATPSRTDSAHTAPAPFILNADGFQVTTATATAPSAPEPSPTLSTRDNAPSSVPAIATVNNNESSLKDRLTSLHTATANATQPVDMIAARRTVVFLLDKSGSMYEAVGGVRRVDLATQELRRLIAQLDSRTKFNIVLYAEKVISFRSEAIPATPESKMMAIRFLQSDTACGGSTDFPAGYQLALAQKADTVLLLTDGEFNAQDQMLLSLARNLRQKYNSQSQLNALGFFVRPDTNAGKVLAKLCADSHGELQFWKLNNNRYAALW